MLELAVLVGLAAYRCSRLLARDGLLDVPRHAFFRRFPPDDLYRRMTFMPNPSGRRRWWGRRVGTWQTADRPTRRISLLGTLVGCTWCSSVWFSAAITAALARSMNVPEPLLVWGAAASVSGICATLAA